MNKQDLIQKIKQLEGISQDERAYLIDLVNTKKKYGLVWEDKPEDVEELLRENLPVLNEVKEKAIFNGEDNPNHILIEGDNLHALTALTFTHEGKIDVIYIDPPYNTGNKDFKYNDTFVDKEDSYRHSKWLSFMDKRLRIAKRLLSETGIIFMSIDDNEIAQLKMLSDEIFSGNNFIAELPTIMNLKGNQDQFAFAGTHEYSLVYCKDKTKTTLNPFILDEDDSMDWEEDEYGFFKKGANLKSTGGNAPREKRPNLFFPIFIKSNKSFYVTNNDQPSDINDLAIYPITDGKEMSWRWSKNKFINEDYNVIISGENGVYSIYKKQRPAIGDLPSKKPKSLFYKPEYSSGNGTAMMKSILNNKNFTNPKPLDLIKDFLLIGTNKKSLVLDFFAGSGTTLHATMSLNAEDGGNRQCILVTNNENNICEEVTYERNKRVIEGYSNAKGVAIEGLKNNNLRYFKSEYVSREQTLKNKKELTYLATELLCIKEDCYSEVTEHYIQDNKQKWVKLFANQKSQMVVIYDDLMIEDCIAIIQALNKNKQNKEKIKVYVFSNGQYPYTEDFEDVLPFITLCALPDAIYKAYQNVLPKKQRKEIPVLEDEVDGETDLFTLKED